MARNIVLLFVVMGAGLGLAWYLGAFSQSASEEPGSPVLADATALPNSANSAASSVPATVSPVSPSNQSAVTPQIPGPNPLSEPSLVGLPFELSESVVSNCERSPNGICNELLLFVKRMPAEARNLSWARDMEARIEKAVMSGERGKFRIRALECRSTRCALEVASEVDDVGISAIDPAFDAIMIERPGYFARENDPQTGITTLVSAQVWQTEESYDAEQAVTD